MIHNPQLRIVAIAITAGAACVAVPRRAQNRMLEERELYAFRIHFDTNTGGRATLSSTYEAGETTRLYFRDGSVASGTSTPAPFDVPGGASRIASSGIGTILVCGTTGLHTAPGTPTATVALVVADTGFDPTVLDTTSLPGKDLLAVCWVDALDTLFVVDGTNNEVLGASWTGPGATLPPAAAFHTVFTTSEVAALDSSFVEMQPRNAGIRVFDSSTRVGQEAIRSQGNWVISPFDSRSETAGSAWQVAGARAVPASDDFAIDLVGGVDRPSSSWPQSSATSSYPSRPPPTWGPARSGAPHLRISSISRAGCVLSAAVEHARCGSAPSSTTAVPSRRMTCSWTATCS